MMKKFLLTITAITFIGSCGKGKTAQPLQIKTVRGVKVSTVETHKTIYEDSFPGTVIPDRQIMISPKVVGYLKELKVKTGDRVKKGEVLAVIESSTIKPDVESAKAGLKEVNAALKEIDEAIREVKALNSAAEANYQLAKKTYERFKELHKADAVSEQRFDEVKTKFEAAKSNLKAVEAKEAQVFEKKRELQAKKEEVMASLAKASAYLSYTYLKSPVNGIILQKFVDVGNLISPQTPVFEVGSCPLKVQAFVDSSYAGRIKGGERLPVKIGDKDFIGKVVEIDRNADPISHKFGIKVKINSTDVIPGAYAVVKIPVNYKEEMLIPVSAIYRVGAIEYVFVIKHGIADLRVIKTGKRVGNNVVVLSGLHKGERIAVSGISKLCDGAKVEE